MTHVSPRQLAEALGLPPPTDEQAAVIAAPAGPTLVVAGAGAGKTETMAARVVWMVANRLVLPDQVLGLTFTRKAAQQLTSRIRTRLARLAGAPLLRELDSTGGLRAQLAGAEPEISTYHSYAGRLLTEHGLLLPVEPSATLLTQTQLWQLAHQVVRNWDGDLDTDRTPVSVTEAVLALSGQLAEHLVEAEQLAEAHTELEKLVYTLPAGPRQRGGPSQTLRGLLEVQQERVALLPLVQQLAEALRRRGALDFGAQMSLAARLAAEHHEVATAERARFRLVLLDEYQDTGHAQRVLLASLFGGTTPQPAPPKQSTRRSTTTHVEHDLDGTPGRAPSDESSPAAGISGDRNAELPGDHTAGASADRGAEVPDDRGAGASGGPHAAAPDDRAGVALGDRAEERSGDRVAAGGSGGRGPGDRTVSAEMGGGIPRLAVTAVGDPMQSIYGWRGASAANLPRFATDFPSAPGVPAPTLPLLTSWRNPPEALAVANLVADPLRRSAIDKGGVTVDALRAKPDAGEGIVELALTETVAEERDWIAERIAEEWAARRAAEEPPPTSAVLVRRNADASPLAEALRARGLPVEIVGLGGLLATPEVADIVATLRLIAEPAAGSAAMRILTGARWRIGVADIAALARRARDLSISRLSGGDSGEITDSVTLAAALREVAPEPAEQAGLADAIADPGDAEHYSDAGFVRIEALGRELSALRERSGQPLAELVADVERTIGVGVETQARRAMAGTGAGREHLDAFAEVVAGYAADTGASLSGLLAFFAAAESVENGLEPGEIEVAKDRVQVLTVHAAKGLEWEIVAVPHVVRGVFPSGTASGTWLGALAELPTTLRGDRIQEDAAEGVPVLELSDLYDRADLERAIKAHKEALERRRIDEERRLFYVALTRTERVLMVTSHHWAETGSSPKGPSDFLLELKNAADTGATIDIPRWDDPPEPDAVNPFTDNPATAEWPRDPLGNRRDPIEQGAAMVRAALAELRAEAARPPRDTTPESPTINESRPEPVDLDAVDDPAELSSSAGLADSAGLGDPAGRDDPAGDSDPAGLGDSAGLGDPAGSRDSAGRDDPAGHGDPAERDDLAERSDPAGLGDSAEHDAPAQHDGSAGAQPPGVRRSQRPSPPTPWERGQLTAVSVPLPPGYVRPETQAVAPDDLPPTLPWDDVPPPTDEHAPPPDDFAHPPADEGMPSPEDFARADADHLSSPPDDFAPSDHLPDDFAHPLVEFSAPDDFPPLLDEFAPLPDDFIPPPDDYAPPADPADPDGWASDVDALLAEFEADQAAAREVELPGQIPATALVEMRADPAKLARRLRRPLPFPPNPLARRGTAFHAWVQRWFNDSRLVGLDQLPGVGDLETADAGGVDAELTRMQDAFLNSPWANRSPVEVEIPFETSIAGTVIRGRMDAVFATPGGGWVVVDWKTGAVPTPADEPAVAMQLAIYRLAWARLMAARTGATEAAMLEKISAAFHYVRTGRTVAPAELPGPAELAELIRTAAPPPIGPGGSPSTPG
ncbi:UvrD-helicase domain-containing protein [Nocardia sp. NPDC050712]|uniref:UvrD-helicase domain-containing protein n=1 Tax=Nocardia sp. NPDC050712 TaxID=3155518 RepID=UPI0033CE9988